MEGIKGCQEAGRGTAREGRSPRDTSSVILLSNCLCCVRERERERERARQSKDSLSANKELNGSTLCGCIPRGLPFPGDYPQELTVPKRP